MTCVIYIIGRTDGRADFHTENFIRETADMQLERFVTTSVISNAKKFRNDVAAFRFLSQTSPMDNWKKIKADGSFSITCYEILIVDSVAVFHAQSRGLAPQTLKGGPWARRVFCATLKPERPTSA